jgi:NADH dehydrogenase FAD-containing subunit
LRRLLLLGGGHVHLHIVQQWAAQPMEDVQAVLVSPHGYTTYSGMIAGFIEGLYAWDDIVVDLQRLAAASQMKYIQTRVQGIDAQDKFVTLANGIVLSYHTASLDIGSGIKQHELPGLAEQARWIKPYDRLHTLPTELDAAQRVVIVGGGASGTELAYAIAARQRKQKRQVNVTVVSKDNLLATLGRSASRIAEGLADFKGIRTVKQDMPMAVDPGVLRLQSGTALPYDILLWSTGPGALPLLAEANLPVTHDGYLRVNDRLQSPVYSDLFGGGDCVTLDAYPSLPKSGVYAVRMAPILWHNLQAALEGGSYRHFRPQKRSLALIATGFGEAIAAYGGWAAHGSVFWRWKHRIDASYVASYRIPSNEKVK